MSSIVELPGGGDGPFTSRPPNYKTRLPQVKDGNIFYVVSYGKNMMGGYGFQLSVKERWQVIHYIKSLAGMKGEGTVLASADTTAKTKKKIKSTGSSSPLAFEQRFWRGGQGVKRKIYS